MTIEIKVPPLPESVSDATLVAWHKKEGEHVARDENLADLETDKVVLEVPAPAAGVLRALKVAPGATVHAGDLLAVLDETAAATDDKAKAPAPVASTPAARKEAPAEASSFGAPSAPAPAPAAAQEAGEAASSASRRPPTAPSARRIAEEHGLDPHAVAGRGRDGRVTKQDVLAHLASGGVARTERRVPMNRIRARIAERLLASNRETVMLTSFNEIDLGRVLEIRNRYREAFEKEHGVRLGLMSFFVAAAVRALKRFPIVNASVDGDTIVYHDYWDIGIAVSSPRGLVVPVLRNADRMDFAGIEGAVAEYATRAREGKLELADLEGGTFTITNGGVFGSLFSTPIINPPQSAILGMHKIQERPVAVDGAVVVRPMMYVALTYDHRIIDGREAVLFLVAIKDALEDPARLLLDL
jgi:2-oxoglutarate dehydrogenase E2 component (dihydrolipoamide succinyltransferase)